MNQTEIIKMLFDIVLLLGGAILAFLLGKRSNGVGRQTSAVVPPPVFPNNTNTQQGNSINLNIEKDKKNIDEELNKEKEERRKSHVDVLKELQQATRNISKEIHDSITSLRIELREDISDLSNNFNSVIIETIRNLERLSTQSDLLQAQVAEIFSRVSEMERKFLTYVLKNKKDDQKEE